MESYKALQRKLKYQHKLRQIGLFFKPQLIVWNTRNISNSFKKASAIFAIVVCDDAA